MRLRSHGISLHDSNCQKINGTVNDLSLYPIYTFRNTEFIRRSVRSNGIIRPLSKDISNILYPDDSCRFRHTPSEVLFHILKRLRDQHTKKICRKVLIKRSQRGADFSRY